MRFGIFCSGQTRKLDKTKLFKHFATIPSDFYFHSWIDDENNPNWSRIQDFYPGAKIKLEKYSDEFDNYAQYRLMPDLDHFRYHFAQFYTVLQSFRQYKDIGKYDFYFRTRTDINYQTDLLDFFDKNHSNFKTFRRWTWHAIKQTLDQEIWRDMVPDDLNTLLVNNDILDDRVFEIRPIVWSRLRMTDPKLGTVFDDFSWTMNEKAFNILRNADIDMLMKKAIDIKVDSDYVVQSPIVWSNIFKELGIFLIDSPISGNILRVNAGDQNQIPYYGDIT